MKFLTYVSIFYLPLAFCAVGNLTYIAQGRVADGFQSLWAIPNITDKATRAPFIVTAILVGLVTYSFVFNMSFMSDKIYNFYHSKQEHVVAQMRREKGDWKLIGRQFEEFKPSRENKVPSEWLILGYLIWKILPKVSWKTQKPPPTSDSTGSDSLKSNEEPNSKSRKKKNETNEDIV